MSKRTEDIVIIGGGPAGLAAALSARKAGCEKVLILERDRELGGILNQCIHNGFGLHTFKEELTGPEYAERYIDMAEEAKIPYLLNTMVTNISLLSDGRKKVTAMNKEDGLLEIETETVVLAMGCRERSRGALNIPGSRPAGIYSAGTAQYYVNIRGRMPGKNVVILGSGDIGLIMARRMVLEGAKVQCVAELRPQSGGLKRNIVQCLDDFNIPLYLNTTVAQIHGRDRVEGVTLTKVDDNGKPIPGSEWEVPCDTLLLSCGLIPENELTRGLGADMDGKTGGPVVGENLECSIPGVFACGNVLHVHELVDHVSAEAEKAGDYAVEYIRQTEEETDKRTAKQRRTGRDESMKKKQKLKERICALVLALAMVLTWVLPDAGMTVQAAAGDAKKVTLKFKDAAEETRGIGALTLKTTAWQIIRITIIRVR